MSNEVSEIYDFLLINLESSIFFIKDGDRLQIISNFIFNKKIGRPEKYYVASITSANSNFSPVFSDHILSSPSHHGLTLEDFELIKVIGKGGFSKVF